MHPLFGPRLKLSIARDEIEALDKAMQPICDPKTHGRFRDVNSEPGWEIYRADPKMKVDHVWSVRIGEIAHNLRSALDNLFFQLVRLNGIKPNKTHQFPIFIRRKKTKARKGRCFSGIGHGDGMMILKGFDPKHITLMKRLQPYQRLNGGRYDPLWLLHEINNADKHRLIQVTTLLADEHIMHGRLGPGIASVEAIEIRGTGAFKRGAELYRAQGVRRLGPDVDVDVEVTLTVGFGKRRRSLRGLPVIKTLRDMDARVWWIIESFAPEFP